MVFNKRETTAICGVRASNGNTTKSICYVFIRKMLNQCNRGRMQMVNAFGKITICCKKQPPRQVNMLRKPK